ncbi:ribonuclease H-like domain, reverse transcriptase, RNA-dependent DNA polymerase [Tanacetum coccineum]
MTKDKDSGEASKKEVGTTSTPQFQCPMLKPSNYSLWAIRMQIILEANGLWEMKNPVFHGRSKHIDIKYHFIRECMEREDIQVEFINGEYQKADILTKALPKIRFLTMRQLIGLKDLSSNACDYEGEYWVKTHTGNHNPQPRPAGKEKTQLLQRDASVHSNRHDFSIAPFHFIYIETEL